MSSLRKWGVVLTGIIAMTAGSAVLMWIGEQITEKGVGNGISIVLTINIISGMPSDISNLFTTFVTGGVPVIILTAREEEEDKILGLEIGADDYITKPFSMRELMARVKANIRRTAMVSGAAAESGMSAGGALTINTDRFQVFKNGKPIELTQREYELLTFLASHPDKVFSRVDLMEQVWNYGYVGDDVRTVDVTVRRLREKIEDDPASPRYILTRRGVGYYYSTL